MANFQNNNIVNSIPNVTKNILIINFIIWLACSVFDQTQYYLPNILGLHYFQSEGFRIYQLITYMFTHEDFFHLFFNMFALFMFGAVLEHTWGPKRFLTYYIITGIGAAIVQMLIYYLRIQHLSPDGFSSLQVQEDLSSMFYSITIGASGAVFGILLAFGMLFPDTPMMILFFPVPIKAKYLVLGYGLMELFMGISNRTGDNVAHFAHLGGMAFGWLMIMYWRKGRGISGFAEKFTGLFRKKSAMHVTHNRFESEYDYNARKNSKNEEIDLILEKVKKSGYDSLTSEEKKKLFDAGNNSSK